MLNGATGLTPAVPLFVGMEMEYQRALELRAGLVHVVQQACQKYACPKGCTVVTVQKPPAAGGEGAGRAGTAGARAGEQVRGHLPLHRQEGDLRPAVAWICLARPLRLDAAVRGVSRSAGLT